LFAHPIFMANPFETLGLTPAFALTPAELEQRQRELNRAVHPDRHAGKGPAERRLALSRAMDINQAYRTLRDPASRAEALFELLGEDTQSERTVSDPLLLGEMLEQREILDEVRRSKDIELLASLKASMRQREARVIADLELAFAPLFAPKGAPDAANSGSRASQLSQARRCLTELRYVRRFSEEVAAIEDAL
jgi:molecular chaperone HscB